MLSETKPITWEWVAGFFEGEGCIQWLEGRKGTSQGTCGRLTIGQKVKEPLERIYEFLLDQGFHSPAFYLRPGRYPAWILTVQWREDVICMLEQISPWLIQKRAKADYVHSRLRTLVESRDAVLSQALELRRAGLGWREISRQCGVKRRSLLNYGKSKGMDLHRQRLFADGMAWRDDRIHRGLCESCGRNRGEDGTARKCRSCAKRYNHWRNKHRAQYGRSDRRLAERKGSPRIDYEIVLCLERP